MWSFIFVFREVSNLAELCLESSAKSLWELNWCLCDWRLVIYCQAWVWSLTGGYISKFKQIGWEFFFLSTRFPRIMECMSWKIPIGHLVQPSLQCRNPLSHSLQVVNQLQSENLQQDGFQHWLSLCLTDFTLMTVILNFLLISAFCYLFCSQGLTKTGPSLKMWSLFRSGQTTSITLLVFLFASQTYLVHSGN